MQLIMLVIFALMLSYVFCSLCDLGDDCGQVPGSAERLHHPLSGQEQGSRAFTVRRYFIMCIYNAYSGID